MGFQQMMSQILICCNSIKPLRVFHYYYLFIYLSIYLFTYITLRMQIIEISGPVFNKHSQEDSLYFSPDFVNFNVSQLLIG